MDKCFSFIALADLFVIGGFVAAIASQPYSELSLRLSRFAPNMAAYGAAPKGDVIVIANLRAPAPAALRARWRGEVRLSRVRHGANEKSNLRAFVDSGECE